MQSRRFIATVSVLLLSVPALLLAQSERHGRKYKAPPETSHLEILVVKDFNGKVIENAGVVFHPFKDGVDEGNLEVKSGPDGKAFIDIIPTGSDVQVQVIASGFETYAGTIKLDTASKQVTIRMKHPSSQVSAYGKDEGRTGGLQRSAGVQEPIRNQALPPGEAKPLAADAPVIKLSAAPAKPSNKENSANSGRGSSTTKSNNSSAPQSN